MRQGLGFPALIQKGQSLVFDGLAWSLSYVLTATATLTATRIPVAGASGALKDSQLADGVTGGVLTIAGTLTAPRTITIPDASVTIPTGTLLTGTLANANRLDSTSSAGVVKESQIADGVTGSVLTIAGTLTGLRTQTARDASGNLCLDSVNNAFTVAQTFGATINVPRNAASIIATGGTQAALRFGAGGTVQLDSDLDLALRVGGSTSFYTALSITALGATYVANQLIVGTDPGGSELLRVGGSTRFAPAATQDAVVLAGRAGGTSSFSNTITTVALTASRIFTLPDASVTIPAGTLLTGTLANANRLDSTSGAGVVKESQIADAVTGNVLTIAGTLTAPRTVTLPDAAVTIPAGTLITGTLANANRLNSTSAAGVIKESLIADGISTSVLTIAGTLTAPRTHTHQDIAGTIPLIEVQPVASFQNKLINPRFDIAQRGASFAAIASGAYHLDRWAHVFDGSGVCTISQQAHTIGSIPTEPEYFLRYQVTTASAGGTYRYVYQAIENVRSLAGKRVQVTFYAKADAARTVGVQLQQYFGTGGAPSATGSASGSNASLTTAWQQFTQTITLPSISGKTVGTNRDSYLALRFDLPLNVLCTIDISEVEVKEVAASGQVNTPFEIRPPQVELALCQRYLPSIPASNTVQHYAGNGLGALTTQCVVIIPFPVQPRIPPTGLMSSAVGGFGANDSTAAYAATSLVWVAAGFNAATININVAAGLVQFRPYILQLSSTSSIQFTGCEL